MSEFSELKERLARLNPEQRAFLTRRLAAGRDTSPSDVYLEMVPAVPLRTEVFGQPGESPRQIAVYPASQPVQGLDIKLLMKLLVSAQVTAQPV